jgi:exodeoxyribonuclease VII small subunit
MSDPAENDAAPTFEAALEDLQTIVHELEEGRLGLETSLARFEQGVGLLRNCYRLLEQAEQRIEVLTGTDAQGNAITAPFDATATLEADDKGVKKPGRRRTAAKSASTPAEPKLDESESDEQRLF